MFDKYHPDCPIKTETYGSVTAGLAEAFREALAGQVQVGCGEIFILNIYNRELVADCQNKTREEIGRMAGAILGKAGRTGRQICSANGGRCPDVELINLEILRDECCARLWEVDVRFTLRCFRRGG